MRELTATDFDATIRSGKVAVDFWAPWCGPCKLFAPIFEATSKEHRDIVFAKVNVDEHPEISSRYGVRGIPTLLLFRDGEVVGKQVGAMNKPQFEALLQQAYKG